VERETGGREEQRGLGGLTGWVLLLLLLQADLFNRIDRDRSGTLEREELEMCLTSAC
jgi:hypothetical protein